MEDQVRRNTEWADSQTTESEKNLRDYNEGRREEFNKTGQWEK